MTNLEILWLPSLKPNLPAFDISALAGSTKLKSIRLPHTVRDLEEPELEALRLTDIPRRDLENLNRVTVFDHEGKSTTGWSPADHVDVVIGKV